MATALHLQQQIINAVKAALTGATDAGNNVFADRLDALPKERLPALRIEEPDNSETTQEQTIHGLEARDFVLTVDNIVRLTDGYGEAARALGLQTEKLLTADDTLYQLCGGGVRLISAGMLLDGAGDRPIASRRQAWRFTYYCRQETPDVPGFNPL